MMSLFNPLSNLSSPQAISESSLDSILAPLNEAQLKAAICGLDQNVQVMAGAGTGKTKLITARSIYLMQQVQKAFGSQNPEEHLWIATFSEKAADKLQQEIAQLYQQAFNKSLSKDLYIGTIHSLCKKMLDQVNHQAISGTQSRTILDELGRLLLAENFIELLVSIPCTELDKLFNTDLPLGIDYVLLDPLVWFNLGLDNFTELLDSIVFQLIPKIKAYGYSPEQFYQTCKLQSQASWQQFLELPSENEFSKMAFSSLEEAALVWENHLIDYSDARFSFIPSDEELNLEQIRQKSDKPLNPHSVLLANVKFITQDKQFVHYDGRKKQFNPVEKQFDSPQRALILEDKLIDLVTLLYHLYQTVLKAEGAMDFDDLILEAIAFLESNRPEAEMFKSQFKHLLLDEFQDTNASQLQLVQVLRGQSKTALTVVGDIKQSIYGFRNAQPENLYQVFEADEKVESVFLQNNYRSVPQITRLANRCCELMGLEKDQYLYPVRPPQDSHSSPIAWLDLSEMDYQQSLLQEELWISNSIEQKISSGQCQPQEIAILVLDHRKAKVLEQALVKKGIKVYRQKQQGFFDHPLFQGICSLFSLLENPNDDLALVNLLQLKLGQGDLFAIAKAKKQVLEEKQLLEPELSVTLSWSELVEIVLSGKENGPSSSNSLFLLREWWSHWQKFLETAGSKSYDQILELMMEEGWLEVFFTDELLVDQFENIQFLLAALKSWASTFEASQSKAKAKSKDRAFILRCLKKAQTQNILELKLSQDVIDTNDAVLILTIHASKGLEFPVVYYAGVENYRALKASNLINFEPQFNPKKGYGLFLNNFENKEMIKSKFCKALWLKPRAILEKLRLEYVAMTRAENELLITSGDKSFSYLSPELFNGLIKIEKPLT